MQRQFGPWLRGQAYLARVGNGRDGDVVRLERHTEAAEQAAREAARRAAAPSPRRSQPVTGSAAAGPTYLPHARVAMCGGYRLDEYVHSPRLAAEVEPDEYD